MVDLLVGSPRSSLIQGRLRGSEIHVPAHFDAEVFSALGRLERGGHLTTRQVLARVKRLSAAPFRRHLLMPLLDGAWRRRHNLRFVDALYVELATRMDAPLITTDTALAAASSSAEVVTAIG